ACPWALLVTSFFAGRARAQSALPRACPGTPSSIEHHSSIIRALARAFPSAHPIAGGSRAHGPKPMSRRLLESPRSRVNARGTCSRTQASVRGFSAPHRQEREGHMSLAGEGNRRLPLPGFIATIKEKSDVGGRRWQ